MQLGVKRENLEKELLKVIYDVNTNNKMLDTAFDKLVNVGYSVGDAMQMLNGSTPLEFMPLIDLGVLTTTLYEISQSKRIKPEAFFTELELKNIREYNNMDENEEGVIDYPLTFENVFMQETDQWIGVISIAELVKLLQAKMVRYNYKTQRNPLFVKHMDSVIQRPNINKKSVKEINNKMLKGQFIPDAITLNILADGTEDFSYDARHNKLTLKEGNLDILDGMHRAMASINTVLANPNIELNFGLHLTNFNEDKARRYILQKDLQTPLDKEYKVSLDTMNLNNSVVNSINTHSESELRGLIVTDQALVQTGDGITLYSVMSKGVSRLWNLKTRKESNELSEYLIRFFNEMVGLYPDHFKHDIKKKRYKNYMTHHNMIIFYLTIAKELQGRNDWKKALAKVMRNVNFSVDNSYWDGKVIGLYDRNFNNKIGTIIKDYRHLVRSVPNG